MLIENHPTECREVVKQIVPEVLKRLLATFSIQVGAGVGGWLAGRVGDGDG